MSEPVVPSGGLKPAGPSNLRLRIISGVTLAVIVLALTWIGGWPFRLLMAAMALAIAVEWLNITSGGRWGRQHWLTVGIVAAFAAALAIGLQGALLVAILMAGTAVAIAEAAASGRSHAHVPAIAYAGLGAMALALLRGDAAAGFWAVLFLFAVVWATDILAYFVGRAVGGPKLAPSISPGKTWSGAIGGTVAGIAAGAALAAAAGASMLVLAAVALLLSVVGQIGDLFESALKRRFGVKDSGTIIPGHGGVMDRVDALVAAGIAFYVVCAVQVGLDQPALAFFAR